MGKYYENCSTFAYSWEQIVTAFWKRYPNPFSTHVLSEDTLNREIIQGNTLFTRRILTKTNRVPKWGERFVKSTTVAIVEESYVDRKTKILTTYTRNIGLNRIMSVTEKVIYTPDPSNPGHTVANRMAWIDSQMYGFRRAIEAFGLERFRTNSARASAGFVHILQILYPNYQNKLALMSLHASSVPSFDETKEKFKEKAKKAAGEIARQSAEKISLVSNANVDS
ncbi:protein preli-like [Folsomia candida]|uniref:Protein preli-like n=1 Tax=Folsomia candida TaxID=158441 RepID=A0A226EI71_FOLCA|nr:protein preli-like [Folsomia candida]OXA56948.1 Protein preli-like [Folsomia candida]